MLGRYLLIIYFLFSFGFSFSQIGIYNWREHLPYNNAISVVEGENNRIYVSTSLSLFYFNRNDNSLNRINKISGLSDVKFGSITFDKNTKTLLIGYTNGNLDLIHDDNIYNMPDIKRKNIIGGKSINNINVKDGIAYLATDFGIVLIDINKKEVSDTWYIGPEGSKLKVLDFDYNDSIFMASTTTGIFYSQIEGVNHAFYENWQQDTLIPNHNLSFNTAAFFKDKIVVNNSNEGYETDTMFIYDNGNWDYFNLGVHFPRHQIINFGDTLFCVNSTGVNSFYNDLNDNYKIFNYNQPEDKNEIPNPRAVIRTSDGTIFIADHKNGLVENPKEWLFKYHIPEGPAFSQVVKMDIEGNSLWAVSGAVDQSWNNTYASKGAYNYFDEEWSSINKSNTNAFDTIPDVISVAVNPNNPDNVFIGSWGKGLIEIKNNEIVNIYNDDNSTISEAINRKNFFAIGGLCYDDENRLWVTNSFNTSALSVRDNKGKWHSFKLNPYVNEDIVGDIVIDDFGQKWIILPRGNSLMVYNDNNTIANTFDDSKELLTGAVGRGNLPSTNVLSLAIDLDGQLWIGTDKGVAVIYSPENVFTGFDYDAQQIYVEQKGISQYLLESEEVSCITVDGANNKWFGTKNSGAFYMSDDGTEQIYHFTTDNSPLLSNHIFDIDIDDETGEVFFATENGIVSYKNVATKASENNSAPEVYPNPVKPSYNGPIAIKNLSRDASVKITDISSNLVFEGFAEGGQITWNGKNLNGERVATGVYLVFVTNDDGSSTMVAKILFIK